MEKDVRLPDEGSGQNNDALIEALKQSERRLSEILDFLPDATFAIDKDKKVILWNKAIEKMTGIAAKDMIGKGDHVYTIPFYGEARPQLMDLIWENDPGLIKKYSNINHDGEYITSEAFCNALNNGKGAWVFLKISPLYDAAGNITGAIETIRDITESKTAMEMLDAKKEEMDQYFRSALDLLCIASTSGHFIRLNPKWERVLGYTVSELEGKYFLDFVHPDDLQPTIETMMELANQREVLSFENRYRCKDGTYRWIEWRSRPEGEKIYAAARDVTFRKQAEEDIRDREDKLRMIIETSPDAIVTTTLDGEIQTMSPSAIRMWGYKSFEETRGKNILDLTDPVHLFDKKSYLKRIIDGTLSESTEIQAVRKDGDRLYIEGNTNILHNSAGHPDGILFIFRDVTGRRQKDELIHLRLKLLEYSKDHNLNELLTKALDEISAMLNSPVAFYHFVNEDMNAVYLQEWSTATKEVFCNTLGESLHLPVDQAGIWADCIKTREPVIHNDYQHLQDKKGFPEGHPQLVRELLVPVIRENKIVALLGIGNKPTEYTSDDVEYVSFIADVTWEIVQTKTAEESLRQSEERFREMADMLPQVIYETDLEGRLTYVNKRAYQVMGFSEEDEVFGNFLLSYHIPEEIPRVNEFVKKNFESSSIVTAGFTLRKKDGSTFPALIYSNRYLKNGKPAGLRGLLLDISDIKKTENLLRETNAYLENLFNYANAPIIVWDTHFNITRFNHAFEHLTGLKEKDVLGKPLEILFPSENVGSSMEKIRKTLTGERWESVEIEIQDVFGSVHTVLWNSATLFEGIYPVATIAQGQDITQRKQTEEELQKNEEKYRLLTENSSDVIWVLNLNQGRFTYISPSVFQLRGLTVEEALNEKMEDSLSPESFKEVNEQVAVNLPDFLKYPDNPIIFLNEIRQPHKNGNMIWVEVSTRYRFNKSGEIEVVGSSRNIDERKRLEMEQYNFFQTATELANAIARLRVDALDDGLTNCLGILARYLKVHRAYIYSNNPGTQTWKNTHEWCAPEAKPQIEVWSEIAYDIFPGLNELINAGEPLILPNLDILPNEMAVSVRPILEQQDIKSLILYPMAVDGQLIGFVGFDDVLRERMFAENELGILKLSADYFSATVARYHQFQLSLEANKDLQLAVEHANQMTLRAQAANKAKSEFLANISHEIRTPMNSILGFSEVMINTTSDPKQRNYLKTILDSGKALLSLINDLLDLSKIEAGRMEISANPADLRLMLNETMHLFQHKIQEKNLEFSADIDKGFPHSLLIDEIRLRQILLNLVGNAVKFTEKGFVKIEITLKGQKNNTVDFEIAVIDSGIGIPAEDQERIFESFSQQSGQDSKKYGGTGLGLAISRRLTELMKGKMTLESTPGKGSRFAVQFTGIPVSKDAAEISDEYLWNDQPIDFKGSKILVVDDVAHNRDLVLNFLQGFNLTIYEASNGESGVELASLYHPDLVLMDIRMPGISGYEAADRIKNNPETSAAIIVAITASAMQSDIEKTRRNFSGYLRKPVQKNTLIRELMKFIPWKKVKNPEVTINGTISVRKNPEQVEINKEIKREFREKFSKEIIHQAGTMIVDDLQELSVRIEHFAIEHNIEPLMEISTMLQNYILDFDYDKIQLALTQIDELFYDYD